jgi:uncharacterized protein YecT (DUF1311 family)
VRRAAIAALVAASALAPAGAAAGAVSAAARDGSPLPCDRNTTVGMAGCFERQTLAVDRRIDAAAVRIRAARSPAAARRFDAAQRAWLAYRTADCTSAADRYEGGSAASVEAASCRLDLSRARLAALQRRLHALSAP